MKFDKYPIHQAIKKNIQALAFKKPTDIQYKSIPSILKGEDVLAVAQTGTGMTAAFVIPILHLIIESKKKTYSKPGIKCIVLVPTHELAIQVTDVFNMFAKGTRINIVPIYGGVDQDPQIQNLNKQVDVLVATPGRMFDLIAQGYIKTDKVEILTLDEADHMLDLGFINDIRDLSKKLPRRRQTLFFSATINEKIKKLAYSLIRQSAIRIQISPKDPVAKNVEHGVLFVEMDDKRFFLERMINENEDIKMLVFVRTKVRAERVKKAMERVQIECLAIHGDKTQQERDEIMKNFKSGEARILIATDISARGIDIQDVEIVVNYDLPDKPENYVHRVGRTGRARSKGQAVSLCSEQEKPILKEIEAYLKKPVYRLEMTKSLYKDVIFYSNEKENDWKRLLEADEAFEKKKKKKKK